ncbi:MAG: hypothetical protein ACRD3S_08065 [Terracidiphilus sp.]
MYPAKVTDAEIRRVIQELTVEGRLPSGAGLRAVLAQRYGSPGGASRIYRLLTAEESQRPEASRGSEGSEIEPRLLKAENQQLRSELQEARRLADQHQAYWHWKVGQLHVEFKKLQPQLESALGNGKAAEQLLKEVQETELRSRQLETLLRAFGPSPEGPRNPEGRFGEKSARNRLDSDIFPT